MDLYDSHGIFVFPSLHEGFGKAFLEAMCRGLCVVASRVGGMADVITSGRDGILVEVGDAAACAEEILRLGRSADLCAAMSARGRARALEYSWERTAREIAAFYTRLLEHRGPRA